MMPRPFFARVLLVASATLALAACQKPADAPVADNAANGAAPVNSVETIGEPDASNAALPMNDSASAPTAIPTAFLGRWGMVPNDCDMSRADTKGLVTVSPDSLKFYESMGKLETIESATPAEIKATFAFTGEGQSWTKTMTLALADAGTVLVRTEQDPAATYRHTKCA